MTLPKIERLYYLVFAVALSLSTSDLYAQQATGVYQDYLKDAALTDKKPTRIRLAKDPRVRAGKVGGVWGSLGNGDEGDSFFIGKTPDQVNLQITITTQPGSSLVHFVFRGKDGSKVETRSIQSVPGETVSTWISLKGSLTLEATSKSDAQTFYALYIWHPGDLFDSLTLDKISEVSSGKYATRPTLFKGVKGDRP